MNKQAAITALRGLADRLERIDSEMDASIDFYAHGSSESLRHELASSRDAASDVRYKDREGVRWQEVEIHGIDVNAFYPKGDQ